MDIRANSNDIEKVLKILKRKLKKDGLMGELKKRCFYEKPSSKLQSKQREAQKRKVKNRNRNLQNRRVFLNK